MSESIESSLNDLKSALLELKPTGADGFEGLLAKVLSEITGHVFRLASSGSQYGKDGEVMTPISHISFECKLYNNPEIPKNELIGKATEIIGGTQIPDVWILGSTVGMKSQILETLQSAFERNAISLLVLDWPNHIALPPLACACALAKVETSQFLIQHLQDKQKAKSAKAALKNIQRHKDFKKLSTRLKHDLQEPTLGLPIAVAKNRQWLRDVFSDRRLAKQFFGQVLAPLADLPIHVLERPQLNLELKKKVFDRPNSRIIALVGGEGCGKSWIFAQSWDKFAKQPLCIIIPASDLKDANAYRQIDAYFINRLIEQTDDSVNDFRKKRWERQFERWKRVNKHTSPNLVVFVDGLNQNPNFEWARWLDGASAILEKLGGVLVISLRQSYFLENIKGAVYTDIEHINIPEWTSEELRQLLEKRGIIYANVAPVVLKTLRNPRILSIAFELLDNTQIETFSELSVERLLFEHIRMSEKDNSGTENPGQFMKRLSLHAEEIIARIKEQKKQDRLVFESGISHNSRAYNLSKDLLAVTEGRFYNSLSEDPTLYSLTEEGLAVALGISIIAALQKAERNDQDLHETIEELLEPIAALDNTSQAIFSALLLAIVDDCTTRIQQVLIEVFLRLQNIDTGYYPAFSSVTRKATDAAMNALFRISTINGHVEKKDWLLSSLREQRKNPQCWIKISRQVEHWLRIYSLAPELSVLSLRINEDQVKLKEKTEEKRRCLEERLMSMTEAENAFLKEKMHRDDKVDPSDIAREAFVLIAGMPLSGFSEALVSWCFSQSLNSSHRVPSEEFRFLVRLNQRDWSKTRVGLMKDSLVFQEEDASQTAKWALLNILRATSTLEDAEHEAALYEELTVNMEKLPGWRLVEKYCPNDPCDPTSSKPEEIEITARKYEEIRFSELSKSRMICEQDRFLREALPGVARFAGDVATKVHRNLASEIARRDGEALRLGLFYLESNTAALTPKTVEMLLGKAVQLSMPYDQGSTESLNYWSASQYALLIAFPHLKGCEQIEALMSLPSHGSTISKLAEVLKPADPDFLGRKLDEALQAGDEDKLADVLMFACYSGTTITSHSKEVIMRLFDSSSSKVRAFAFSMTYYLKDRSLLKEIVHSAWRADTLDPKEQYFEVWYGSKALILAGAEGIINSVAVIGRISSRLFGIAASILGEQVHDIIAEYLDKSIERVLSIKLEKLEKQLPMVEQNTKQVENENPPRLSLVDKEEALNLKDALKQLSETPDEFNARQIRCWESFEKIEQLLTHEQARLAIEDVGFEAIEAMVGSMPERAKQWANKFLELSDHRLMYVHNIALMLARALSFGDPVLSRKLFQHFDGRSSFLSLTYGLGEVPLNILSIWKSADNSEMDALRALRLDQAFTDHDVAVEVLAALISGKAAFIDQYVKDLLQRFEPSATARALMIYGFGNTSSGGCETLDRYADAKGFIGNAAKAARFAYDRDCWSRHWFDNMCETQSSDDFWRYSVLFLKIADARFELWESDYPRVNSPAKIFEPSLESKLKDRIKSWAKKRGNTLFGARAPSSVFALPNQS